MWYNIGGRTDRKIRIFRGELVYNKLGKDEIIVSISLFIFVLAYRILEDSQVNMISLITALSVSDKK